MYIIGKTWGRMVSGVDISRMINSMDGLMDSVDS